MKLVLSIFLLITFTAHAQFTEGDQYYINLPAQNPAFTGIDNFVDVQLRYRKTWSQFGNKPSMVGLSVYGMLGKAGSDAFKNNSFRVSDPSIYGSRPSTIIRKHGFGTNINSFSIGGYKKFTGSAQYAYHIPVGNLSVLALGTSFQWDSERFNVDGLTVRDPVNDQFYQNVMANGYGTISHYSISFGGAYYTPSLFVAIGSSQLIRKNVSGNELAGEATNTQFHMVAGYTIQTSTTISVQPLLRLAFNEWQGKQVSLGMRARFKDIFSAGVNCDWGQKISYLISVNAMNKVRVYYAYDQFINDLKEFRIGNHEVIIRVPMFNTRAFNSYSW